MKFYAVKVGRAPGIYASWPEAEAQVRGVPAVYKSFRSRDEAERWLAEPIAVAGAPSKPVPITRPVPPVPPSRPNDRVAPRKAASAAALRADALGGAAHEFWVHGAYSAQSGRAAWALLSDREPPIAQRYAGPPPEHPERGVLCALLRLLTRANLDPLLRDQPLRVHLGHPHWCVYQALSDWIHIWVKKRWRDGAVINCDLYQTLWPLLKTTNLRLEYHNPQRAEPPQLVAARQLALATADGGDT
jgi:ribonuclease HI